MSGVPPPPKPSASASASTSASTSAPPAPAAGPAPPPDSLEALQREAASLRELLERTQSQLRRDFHSALEESSLSAVRSPLGPPDGIVQALVCKHGLSGLLQSELTIRSSADDGPSVLSGWNAADVSAQTCFCTDDRPGQWLLYSFKDRPRQASSYVIWSCPFASGSVHPRSWTLEGSNDGTEWVELDRRSDNEVLNGASILGSFGIEHPGAFRDFRLRQTGVNHSGNSVFALSYFDLCSGQDLIDVRARVTLEGDEGGGLDGIIAYLTRECGGNVSRQGVVKVTGIPLDNASNHAVENVVELQDPSSHFWSKDTPNQWFSYDFKNRRIFVRGYGIRSTSGGDSGFNHLRSWVIEVSESNEGPWTEVDRRVDNSQLNSRSALVRFDVADPQESQVIRLRQTDRNYYHSPSGCTNSIVISGFELFGDLILTE